LLINKKETLTTTVHALIYCSKQACKQNSLLCYNEIKMCYFETICHDCPVRRVSTLHTRQSSTQSDKYQVSHRYSYFSCWWANSHPKHVEKRNKHTKRNCASSWLYLQDYTGMHGQQTIKINYCHYW